MNVRTVRDERGGGCGRVHHGRFRVVEDRVILVLAVPHDRIDVHPVVMKELVAEVPAARPLQQIAANGRGVPYLRRRGVRRSRGESGIPRPDLCGAFDPGERDQCAEHQSAVVDGDIVEPRNRSEIDDPRRPHDAFLHQVDQIDTACLRNDRVRRARCRHQRGRLLDRRGVYPFERLHVETLVKDYSPSAASTFAGVIGSVRIRLPVAL